MTHPKQTPHSNVSQDVDVIRRPEMPRMTRRLLTLIALTVSWLWGLLSIGSSSSFACALSSNSKPCIEAWVQEGDGKLVVGDKVSDWKRALIEDPNEDAKLAAAQGLLQLEVPDQQPELIRIFRSTEEPAVRQAIIRAYSIAIHDGLIEELLPAVVSDNTESADAAMRYFDMIQRNLENWTGRLASVAIDKEQSVERRRGAVRLLGEKKQLRDAIPALIILLKEESLSFPKVEVSAALSMITRQKLGEDPLAWETWWGTHSHKDRDVIIEEELNSLKAKLAELDAERLEFAKRILAIDPSSIVGFLKHADERVRKLAIERTMKIATAATEIDAPLMLQAMDTLLVQLESVSGANRAPLMRAIGPLARFAPDDARVLKSVIHSLGLGDVDEKLAAAHTSRTFLDSTGTIHNAIDQSLRDLLGKDEFGPDGIRLLVGLIRAHGSDPGKVDLGLMSLALSVRDSQVRLSACEVVGQVHSPLAASALAATLDPAAGPSDSTVRFRAVSELANVVEHLPVESRSEFVAKLLERLEDESVDIRRQTIKKLRVLTRDEVFARALELFQGGAETEISVIEEYVRTLAALGESDALIPLSKALASLEKQPTGTNGAARGNDTLTRVFQEEIGRICDRPGGARKSWTDVASHLIGVAPRSSSWALTELLAKFSESGERISPEVVESTIQTERGIRFELGKALSATKEFDRAWEHVKGLSNNAPDSNPRPIDVVELQAVLAFQLEKWDVASVKYEDLAARSEDSVKRRVSAWLDAAYCHVKRSEFQVALDIFLENKEALEKSPRHLPAAGIAANRTGQVEMARVWLTKVIESAEAVSLDAKVTATAELASIHLRENDNEGAVRVFASIRDLDLSSLGQELQGRVAEIRTLIGDDTPSGELDHKSPNTELNR